MNPLTPEQQEQLDSMIAKMRAWYTSAVTSGEFTSDMSFTKFEAQLSGDPCWEPGERGDPDYNVLVTETREVLI